MIEGLHHIAILCSEKDKSLAFYRDSLGFSVCGIHHRPERGDEIILLKGYGVMLELFVAPNRPLRVTSPEAYGLRHLAFRVSDIENTVNSLILNGYSPEEIRRDSLTGEKMTFVKDPDGLPIELHE